VQAVEIVPSLFFVPFTLRLRLCLNLCLCLCVPVQEDVLAALLCPAWPVAAVLHDHLVRRLSADLAAHLAEPSNAAGGGSGRASGSTKDGEGGDGGRRKDPSHVGFLMDQVGAVTLVRCPCARWYMYIDPVY